MLVMSKAGPNKLLSSKFTLGAEGSVAAGPIGRTATAQTDAQMHAEVLGPCMGSERDKRCLR